MDVPNQKDSKINWGERRATVIGQPGQNILQVTPDEILKFEV
jgi:hypothetical protein